MRLRADPEQITRILYRVCVQCEPICVVAFDENLHRTTVERWVRRYEEKL